MGEAGVYAALSRKNSLASLALVDQVQAWDPSELVVRLPSMPIRDGAVINPNGGGDAFCAGIIMGLTWKREQLTLKQVLEIGLLSSLQRVDSSLRNSFPKVGLRRPTTHLPLNPQISTTTLCSSTLLSPAP